MTLDSMSESCLVQVEQYLNSNPYREYAMNKPYIPLSARSNRINKSTSIAFHQLINNQTNPLTLDRISYKLRMKSDLNVNNLPETHRHTNSPMNNTVNLIPLSRKTWTRQPTAVSRTTNSMKTLTNDELNGIEGNAVRVGTLDDLIKQFHREEIRLIHHSTEYSGNLSPHTTNNRSPSFLSERMTKQPRALTEYHFNGPILSRTTPETSRYRTNNNLRVLTNQYSSKRQSRAMTSHDQRIHEKTSEKQFCICNKLTILDPFNSKENQSPLPSTRYIFPAIRPFGYFTKKSFDNIPNGIKKKLNRKNLSTNSTDTDDNSQLLDEMKKSRTTPVDLENDFDTPPNTKINIDLEH